jgi:predicted transcriptional regulator
VLQCNAGEEIMKQTLTVRIPGDLREELERISEAESKPISDLVRESIRRYVAIYTFRRLRKTILPYAEEQGILTDEDVFSSVS